MTNEEAIKVLKYQRGYFCDFKGCPEQQAFTMAIKALEQEPCEDAISRQAVLDYIDKMPSELTADGRRMIRRRTLEEYISDTLPSATPQPKMGWWIYIGNSEVNGLKICKCSNCEKKTYGSHKFCPNCGQPKMKEVEE